MEPTHPNRAVYVVDWDGTCVEEVWPGMGDWLPGAILALRELSSRGKTVVYSLRCHEYEACDTLRRPLHAPLREQLSIRRMLDEAGLHDVDVYPNGRGKPPGKFYIDDRAVRFDGNWGNVLREVSEREEPQKGGWYDPPFRAEDH